MGKEKSPEDSSWKNYIKGPCEVFICRNSSQTMMDAAEEFTATHFIGEKMKNPIIRKLYTRKWIKNKIDQHIVVCEQFQTKNDYRSIASECYDIGRLFELLEDMERSCYYYQRIVDEWKTHPDEIPDYLCVNALEELNRPEEALEVVLMHPQRWNPVVLANVYGNLGRIKEAQLIYTGLSYYSYKFSEVRHSFWRPHYLQEAADLCEKGQDLKKVCLYNKKAVKAWGEMKDNIERDLELIEEAWLYEEAGYIYEKASNFETARNYYRKAESKYEDAYIEDPAAAAIHQIDGDWNYYSGFFVQQIPDFRLLHFRSDGPEENDYRRIKYRILNLEEQIKHDI